MHGDGLLNLDGIGYFRIGGGVCHQIITQTTIEVALNDFVVRGSKMRKALTLSCVEENTEERQLLYDP